MAPWFGLVAGDYAHSTITGHQGHWTFLMEPYSPVRGLVDGSRGTNMGMTDQKNDQETIKPDDEHTTDTNAGDDALQGTVADQDAEGKAPERPDEQKTS